MKRCPACKRTYNNDAQKFCTQDGTPLVAVGAAPTPDTEMGETIRIDSAQLNSAELDDEVTKVISRELPAEVTGGFDPFKTVVSQPNQTTAVSSRETTHDLTAQSPPASSGPTETPAPPTPPPIQPASPNSPTAPPPQPAAPPAAVQLAAAPAKKKSKLPLVLGILAVLFVLGIGAVGAAYWFVVRPMLAARRAVVVQPVRPRQEPTPIVETTPNDIGTTKTDVAKEIPPYSPPADAVQFVNSNEDLDGKLAEHYVDFSFYYPNSWQKDPKAGVPGASNFAKVERRLSPDFTQENFAIGWYSSAGSEEGDRAVFHTLAENLSAQFANSPKFGEYRKVSEGPTKAGVYDGYEFSFESVSRNTDKGDIKIWGRVIFVPPVDGGRNGVTLLMLATSLAPELRSVSDVGVKGELPMMLQSFRFGKQ